MFKSLLAWVGAEGLSEALSTVVRIWLLPALAAGTTAVLGVLNEIPAFYLWLGVLFGVASGFGVLLGFQLWRQMRSVKNKVVAGHVAAMFAYAIDNNQFTQGQVALQLNLENRASFPISVRLKESRNQIGNRREAGQILSDGGILPANSVLTFQFRPIDISGLAADSFLGTIEADFVYGVGKLKYELPVRLIANFHGITPDNYQLQVVQRGEGINEGSLGNPGQQLVQTDS